MSILGLHHITIVSADPQRTLDFYTRVLGHRLIKQTVNFDDPGSYHLYFGNAEARPGSVITFFEWRGAAKGHPGIGGTHHFAMQVADRDGLLRVLARRAIRRAIERRELDGHDTSAPTTLNGRSEQ